MIRIIDKLLLFIYSIIAGALAVVLVCLGLDWITESGVNETASSFYSTEPAQITITVVGIVLFLISLRFFIFSLHRSGPSSAPSIDQHTDFGDIRISLDTIENLALKAASRQRGVKDLRARIHAADAGLDIVLRVVVDGETAIPALTEEMQRSVKQYVEETAGIPVTNVSVFIANIIQSTVPKSRVE
ncbi:alkaline shock response membrane anchor protein AmaP [Paenibacillus protaetiae]|uniref:Alkaline shock response membrane anchor protein AmaP n=1 Tax=Paenibacillus protaetiae TaxID=2509456 RepID=A0A4P6EUS7_9BACL|nr:alkaline shock response membrane anchor protein AmaP [Paenibacillus protaetiae]QAY66245.1 alkaline shock response membrane anchor protein AmaP [Paenibacillus protaetiae]